MNAIISTSDPGKFDDQMNDILRYESILAPVTSGSLDNDARFEMPVYTNNHEPFSDFRDVCPYESCQTGFSMSLSAAECSTLVSTVSGLDTAAISYDLGLTSPCTSHSEMMSDPLDSLLNVAHSGSNTSRNPAFAIPDPFYFVGEITGSVLTTMQQDTLFPLRFKDISMRDSSSIISLRIEETAMVELVKKYSLPELSWLQTDNNENRSTRGLRTASRKPKKRSRKGKDKNLSGQSRSDDNVLAPRKRHALECHNKVEKQYRQRLNQHYLSLLNVLPMDLETGCQEEHTIEGNNTSKCGSIRDEKDTKLSKGEVLEMATQYIRALEQEGELLRQENDRISRKYWESLSGWT
ncbi:hypothetical protein BKA56DRAFT_625528 [Ilyonectria sp. MPI-CAGE-AT-0026]|nr:hypothetical protein BKA56DRAFT_625528 [Ilyonectria sp. MPI-CAGE-AT-0026]